MLGAESLQKYILQHLILLTKNPSVAEKTLQIIMQSDTYITHPHSPDQAEISSM